MRPGKTIEAVGAVFAGDFFNFSDFGKKRKITVYRPQTDVGKVLSYLHVDCVSRRMIVVREDALQNGFSLPAFLHWSSHYGIISSVIDSNNRYRSHYI